MRVCFITHYSSLYGANRSLLNMIDGLQEYGVTPFVIGKQEGDIAESLRLRNIPFQVVPFEWWVWTRPSVSGLRERIRSSFRWRQDAFGRLMKNLKLLPQVIRKLREWDIDVVYSNSSVIPIGFMAAQLTRRPHVWHLRELCDLHYGYHFDCGKKMATRIIASSQAVVSVSKAVEDHYLDGLAGSRKRVVYNGIVTRSEFDRFHASSSDTPPGKHPYTFALVGAIQPNKGQEEAIQALAELSRGPTTARLLLAGAGATAALEKLASSLGVSGKVEFLGHLDEPMRVFQAADAVLMCSRHEAMGRVTVEAMLACRPVIGFDQAGTSELIQHEHNGLLYTGGAKSLAHCMSRFMTDPLWAKAMGKNGWEIARENYCIEEYARSIHQVLMSAVARK